VGAADSAATATEEENKMSEQLYKIKPLEWRAVDKNRWQATSIAGTFQVTRTLTSPPTWQYFTPRKDWWWTAASRKICFAECEREYYATMAQNLIEA
jgi:hypothetical protein